MELKSLPRVLCGFAAFALSAHSHAVGIFADGATAQSQAQGGLGVTGHSSAIDSLSQNPAALSQLQRPQVEVSGNGGWINGDFRNRANDDAELHDFGIWPNGAIGGTFGPLSLGLGVVTDGALRADWRYRDTPGGLDGGTTYGERTHLSEITLTRIALGASYAFNQRFSMGASVGVLYNQNRLKSPYIIQTQPDLAGAKTLLDMKTDGWGVNAQFGVLWKPIDSIRIGLSYTLPSKLKTKGHARADSGQQLAQLGLTDVDATTHFDAEVTNEFPQIVSGGIAWTVTPKFEVAAQLDWVDWSSSFDTLEVRLRNTNNPLYKALLTGKDHLDDNVPLDWRDQWVVRLGAEYHLTDEWTARLGYRYARNPVPEDTLTPLTAAINDHVITAGLGYHRGPVTVDLAYQWYVPKTVHIDDSRLLSGEYSDSTIKVGLHMVAATVRLEF